MEIRQQILEGNLVMPSISKFNDAFGMVDAGHATKLFRAAWHAYLYNKGSINLTYWAEQFSTVLAFNRVLQVLSSNEWFETHAIPKRNWAEASLREEKLLQFVTPEELGHVRATKKFSQYVPELMESDVHSLTKQNGRTSNTGLTRYGLMASAATEFQYDASYLRKYSDAIIANTNKGMQKVRVMFPDMTSDEASYDTVATAIIEELTTAPSTYSMGNNFSDSRGRAIKQGLSKVANPIGYKDFRSLLVIPTEFRNIATDKGVTAIYLFIAELHSFKAGTLLDKELFGALCHKEARLNKLDLTLEEDRKELHENIWLERLYDDLDAYFSAKANNVPHMWSVPLELDASASMLSHLGLLLGDKRLLSMTNTLDTGTLTDPWAFEGINRKMFKTAATPMLYGSSKPCHELWQNNNMEYTLDQVKLLNKELESGALGLAKDLKDFIIRWVKPQANMSVKVYEDTFTIECSRFKNVGEITVRYDIYDSVDKQVRRISHTKTKRVPDLEQFKTWFITGLIHAQDSQVLDFVMEKVMSSYQWGIDIHDAIIICPEAASDTRNWYAEELQHIYDNREAILTSYFRSIGIGREALEDWNRLTAKIQPVENFKASPMALK